MRILQALIALLFVAAGVLFGALNAQSIPIDFGLWQARSTTGVAILLALLGGVLLGGLAISAGVVWPLRRELRKQSRRGAAAEAPADAPAAPPDTLPPPTP